ncbi:TetR family transcriptional regulator [Mycobacteroides abscessus subsp. bolletii]|uniref:TetR/AcrR family transcriptional regulator n=1 Tax=Mycobacteroides abscessus TaxID=36809 RepID=UPI0009C5FD76|nr:TetR/AcrR family transcriptional regulator [Mycobacteroides abscessus]SKG70683.1 TetR family transcriptional regulator [Mycobacteroides abscessus subsp. bolletii]SLF40852.1 TetR family transcriptional regulator [Mycobacteroides abscessus subsp. bolletii]
MVSRRNAAAARLPRGVHALDPAVVEAAQRARIVEAIVDIVSEKGYTATTVADVIERAGISRKTFYEQFVNKEDCFVSAFDHGQGLLAQAIVDATLQAEGPDARLYAGYHALCSTLAKNPSLARVFVVVAPEAGRVIQDRRDQWRSGSVQRLRWLYALSPKGESALPDDLPEFVARAIVGAAEALITHHVETQGAESLPQLVPAIVGIARVLMSSVIDPPSTHR